MSARSRRRRARRERKQERAEAFMRAVDAMFEDAMEQLDRVTEAMADIAAGRARSDFLRRVGKERSR